MRIVCALWVSSVLITGLGYGQTIPAHPRDLTYESLEFEPPNADQYRHELSNGVVVFVVEDHTLPLVNLSLLVRTGSYLEPREQTGLAGLTGEQIRAGGTVSLTAAEFDEQAAFLAAEISSSIGNTMGQANLNCLAKDLDIALQLFFDMLRNPAFDQSRLDLAKSQMLQSMERRNDSTASIERREWNRLMRGTEHFSTWLSTRRTVESITRDDLVEFHRSYYHPGNFIIAVSGDVETDDILRSLEAQLADWPISLETLPEVPEPFHELRPGIYTVDKPDVNQGRVSIGHLGTTRDNPDLYALTVMNNILGGGGFSSRILTRIRSDEGLAYSAGSRFGFGTYYTGVFRAAFQSRSETVAMAAAIMLDEIERMRSTLVTDEELRGSIAYFVETFTRNFSSATSTANLFANNEYTERDPTYMAQYRERILAVTTEDVLEVAKQYLRPDQLVILVVGDIETIETGDPDNQDHMLTAISSVPITRISLPDPFTMNYPSAP